MVSRGILKIDEWLRTVIFTTHNEVGNIFTSVKKSVHRGGACMVGGDMCDGVVCVVEGMRGRGHA